MVVGEHYFLLFLFAQALDSFCELFKHATGQHEIIIMRNIPSISNKYSIILINVQIVPLLN